MSKKKGLTERQQRFVEAYLIDPNASGAARKAGYSPKTAFRSGQENMQKPAILASLADAQAQARKESLMSARQIRQWWVAVIRGEISQAIVSKDSIVVEVPPKMSDRVAASANLAKSLGLFIDRVKVEGEGFILRIHAPSPPESGKD